MENERLEMTRQILCDILGNDNVYTDPPTHLNYPCMILERGKDDVRHADNKRYFRGIPFTLTFITQDEYTEVTNKLFVSEDLPYLSEDRPPFIADGLRHFVYTVYI